MTRHVTKPWGSEEIFASTDRYAGKILRVHAGHALSLQYHVNKDETMRVLAGSCRLEIGPAPGSRELQAIELTAGMAIRIRPGVIHRLVATSDVEIVEVSTPELDDVVRLEDRYGREGTSAP